MELCVEGKTIVHFCFYDHGVGILPNALRARYICRVDIEAEILRRCDDIMREIMAGSQMNTICYDG